MTTERQNFILSMESYVHYRLYTLLEKVYLLLFLWNNLCLVVKVPLKTGVRLSHVRRLPRKERNHDLNVEVFYVNYLTFPLPTLLSSSNSSDILPSLVERGLILSTV